MRYLCFTLLFLIVTLAAPRSLHAAEVIPPAPWPHYIVDQAHVLPGATLQTIDQNLGQFDHTTTNQIVVGVYPKMQSDDDIAAYSVRIFQAWHPGQKGKDNGVLLLIFVDDHKFRIAPG